MRTSRGELTDGPTGALIPGRGARRRRWRPLTARVRRCSRCLPVRACAVVVRAIARPSLVAFVAVPLMVLAAGVFPERAAVATPFLPAPGRSFLAAPGRSFLASPGRSFLAAPAGPAAPTRRWRWPLAGHPAVTRAFQPPPQPWMAGHRGVDLGAAPDALVLAAGSGIVRFAGALVDRGVVSIEHADGLRTTYEPVTPLVRAGQAVTVGDPIGLLAVGHEGCLAAACLHWGLRLGRAYLDPLSLLGPVRVRLLPLADPAS